jgi:phenylpropionate dioxygenase-like ring-hydroxylating dioxygenase large terminal subunit
MKKFAMILLAFILVFGFSSMTLADGHEGKGDNNTTEKVTFHKGVTTIVKTTKEVSHDKIVKTEKDTDYKTVKKSNKSTYNETKVEKKKEKHPNKDWYRDVHIKTTFKVTKTTSWDQVTAIHKITTFTTPVKITKTTVTTIKHKGKPGSNGKVISKTTEKFVDKEHGKTRNGKSKEIAATNLKQQTPV